MVGKRGKETMNTEKDLTFRYALLPAFYWMSFASVMSFSSYYLLGNGYTNTQIGMIAAIAGIFAAILQPVIASYADTQKSPSLKIIELILVGIVLVLGCTMLLSNGKAALFTGIVYTGIITLLQLQTPLVNALGTESLNQGRKLNYGACRSMGSVGYAIMAYLLGIATRYLGTAAVPLSILFVYLCLFLSLLAFPFEKSVRKTDGVKKDNASPLSFFLHYKRFTIVLVGCVLIYIAHVLINNFTLQIVTAKGGGPAQMGFAQAFASILELPTIFFFGYLLKKLRCDIWFRISAFFFFFKTFCTYLAPNITVFYMIQLLQMLGWALMTVSSVYYVNEIMEEQDAIKGQAYMTMTYTLGTVLGSVLGGTLLDRYSVNTMLLVGSIAGFIGMAIICICAEKTKTGERKDG